METILTGFPERRNMLFSAAYGQSHCLSYASSLTSAMVYGLMNGNWKLEFKVFLVKQKLNTHSVTVRTSELPNQIKLLSPGFCL